MKDKLFKVTIAVWSDGHATIEHIKAFDLAHAKRISKRLFGTTRVEVVGD